MATTEMEPDDFLTRIRLKASAQANINRIEKRTFCHNARRTSYSQVAKRIKVPNLDEFKTLCQYFSRDKKLKDLQRIRLGLASDPQYIKVFLDADRALYALVGSFSGINTKLQMESVYCIINLGLGTEDQSLRVCKSASTYLITCIGSNNYQLQGLCCWAFGNLCGGHPEVCALLLSQGFEEAMLRVLSSSDAPLVQWGCYSLNLYLNTVPSRIKQLCTSEVQKTLLRSVSSGGDCVAEASWCLFAISSEPDLCVSLANFGLVSVSFKALYGMVEKGTIDLGSATALVRLISNCVAVLNEVAIEICYQADRFLAIVKLLLRSPYNHLQKETIQMVANVVNGAASQPITGENILEDSNLKRRLEPMLSLCLSPQFQDSPTLNCEFAVQYSDLAEHFI